ncbi:MAG: precorrin-3B C(17)-methyltransferase, partial [Moorea sp. SIO2B7]|nr:precorrin-3B C(17)-methyltransferase [Moorena sp. SIO2B7]
MIQFQPSVAIATTPRAAKTLQPLCQTIGTTLWIPESLKNTENAQAYQGDLKAHIASIWQKNRAFIFCLATGAVVRLIAPLLKDKATDPAVIVIDQDGKFVISLSGGHQGGADQFTQSIAHQLGATPVLTGAANSLRLPGIDVLGVPYGWCKGTGDWTGVSAAISRGEMVEVIQEAGSTLWQNHLPQGHPFCFGVAEDTTKNQESITPKARIWISETKHNFSPESKFPEVQWHPRVLSVGIGCERGTSTQLIEMAIEEVCHKYHLAQEAIADIATIDLKADEKGIIELCNKHN